MQRAVRKTSARTTGKRRDEPAAAPQTALRCVAVCGGSGDPVADGTDLVVLQFHDVTAASLAWHAPDVVLSPLVSETFDCIDLADALAGAGFRGRYRAFATQIPDPDLIRREIRAIAPEIDFDIIVIGPRGDVRDH